MHLSNNKKTIKHTIICYFTLIGYMGLASCSKFVNVGAPATEIGVAQAYQSESSATAAIVGLYSSSYVGYINSYYTGLCGCSADDIRYSTSSSAFDEFENDAVSTTNSLNLNYLWSNSYSQIFQINLAIENLKLTTALSSSVKNQLLGEAYSWRAFMYFYLVNFYGDVPLELTSDVDANAKMPRTSSDSVWAQIISDLKTSATLLTATYPSANRARINQYTAKALLAKAYLYTKDWKDAEAAASEVIGSGTYTLATDLNKAFENSSNEIIWQLATTTGVSAFGQMFLAPKGSLPSYILYDTLYHSFEAGDLRKADWTTSDTIGGTPYYYVYKYKTASGTGSEYNIIFRLAEQYLIRAEARAEQNDITGALTDINIIRNRAGLSSLNAGISQDSVLSDIEKERRSELFGEWGNRWFDLKRTPSRSGNTDLTRADDVLSTLKSGWAHTAVVYPIPATQLIANPHLSQNAGYAND